MRVLVTGGAGFIGSHVVDACVNAGHRTWSLDRRLHASAGFTWCRDLATDPLEVGDAFDVVVHCAAYPDVRRNWELGEGEKLFADNVLATCRLLHAIGKTPVVFLSTSAVYGRQTGPREWEERYVESLSPYAASKLAGEAYVQAYAHHHGVEWVVLRPTCVVGPRYHHGHVADFARMAKEGEVRPANDGTWRKAHVHVLDLVDAIMMGVGGTLPEGVYNVVGESWSPRDTIRVMAPTCPVEWPADKKLGWPGDHEGYPSERKLLDAGWAPRRSVESGVREALASLGWGR